MPRPYTSWFVAENSIRRTMDKRFVSALICLMTGAFLAACCPRQAELEPKVSPTWTAEALAATATPTPPGTWPVVIRGTVYDASVGPEQPIGNARVSYKHHSYYSEVQESGIKWALTGQNGEYELALVVHDTDALVFEVEAQGFEPYSRRFTGLDLHPRGVHRIDLGLTPLPPPTTAP